MSSDAMAIHAAELAAGRPWVQTLHGWVTTVDHKRLGILYVLFALLFLAVAGSEAMIMRIQLMYPHNHFVSPQVFNRMFTMHGTTMVFFMGIPMIFGFANYLVPLMIGARDMAFPRLNSFSFWLTAFGGFLLYFSFLGGSGLYGAGNAPDVGWWANEYHELTKNDGAPFVPYAVWKDLFFAAFILLAVAACALYFGPFGPTGTPDPTIIQTVPKPDYFFLWLYALLSLLPPSMETPALLIGPVIAIGVLVLLPFLSGEGEKSWRRRPIAVLTVLLIAVTLGTFTHLAGFTPWSPHMNAWSGDPVPRKVLHGTTALQRQGALVFQAKQCRNCHSIGESGGQRGPALDSVAVRLTADQLIRQVIQGGGNMPGYGKNLSPAETTALVAFLETLHPAGQTPARDAALDEAQEKSASAQ
jgi:quinol-cytochrome oxidoreductase complex cytochrome b subunit